MQGCLSKRFHQTVPRRSQKTSSDKHEERDEHTRMRLLLDEKLLRCRTQCVSTGIAAIGRAALQRVWYNCPQPGARAPTSECHIRHDTCGASAREAGGCTIDCCQWVSTWQRDWRHACGQTCRCTFKKIIVRPLTSVLELAAVLNGAARLRIRSPTRSTPRPHTDPARSRSAGSGNALQRMGLFLRVAPVRCG